MFGKTQINDPYNTMGSIEVRLVAQGKRGGDRKIERFVATWRERNKALDRKDNRKFHEYEDEIVKQKKQMTTKQYERAVDLAYERGII